MEWQEGSTAKDMVKRQYSRICFPTRRQRFRDVVIARTTSNATSISSSSRSSFAGIRRRRGVLLRYCRWQGIGGARKCEDGGEKDRHQR